METWLTPQEAADRLRLTRRAVYSLLRRGALRGKKFGGSWRIPATEVEPPRAGEEEEERASAPQK